MVQWLNPRQKILKEALTALVLTKSDLKGSLKYQEVALVHLIHMEEGPNPTLFGHEVKTTKETKKIIILFYFLLLFSWKNMDLISWALLLFLLVTAQGLLGLINTFCTIRVQCLFGSCYVLFRFWVRFVCGPVQPTRVGPLWLIFKNYLNTYNLNFVSHWWILLLIFLVLTCESDYCILQFLNELNLIYQRLTGFVASFYSFQ